MKTQDLIKRFLQLWNISSPFFYFAGKCDRKISFEAFDKFLENYYYYIWESF